MPHMLMEHYDSFPTNGILSAASGFLGFLISGVDPVISGIVMPLALFAIGKGIDIVLRLYLDKRNR